MTLPSNRRSLSAVASALALAAAALLIVVLARQNVTLRQRLEQVQRDAAQPRAGLFAPTFTAVSLDGTPRTIGERGDDGRQLLLFFATTCAYCRASLPAWRTLAALADSLVSPRVEVIGVVLDSAHRAPAYAAEHALPYPVVPLASTKLRSLYRARSVPLVMVVDHDGRVLYARTGVLQDGAAVDSVRRAMTTLRRAPAVAPAVASDAGR